MRKFEAKRHNKQVDDFFKKVGHGKGWDKENECSQKECQNMMGKWQVEVRSPRIFSMMEFWALLGRKCTAITNFYTKEK